MSYHPYRTNGSSQPSRPDGMRSVRADLRPSRQVSGDSPGHQISGARRFPHRRQVMGSLHERQRSIGSVLDSGGVLRGGRPRRGRDGGGGRAEGGQVVLPFRFFFNDTATTEIYTLSLHDALPISPAVMSERMSPNMFSITITSKSQG